MDISSQLESVPITGFKQFSWVFIVDWVLAIAVTLFVIFYFNRLVGTLISLIFRWVFWHRLRIRLKVQSVQLSLLGGRIFFKNLTYVGSNEVIIALQGTFTWRYWLHRRRLSKLEAEQLGDVKQSSKSIPVRLSMHIDGLEWFIFNRSAVYDDLFSYVQQKRDCESDTSLSSRASSGSSSSSSTTGSTSEQSTEAQSGDTVDPKDLEYEHTMGVLESIFLRLMPLEIKCHKGAVVLGNNTTPSVLVMHFYSGKSTIDVGPSTSPLDKYKMSYVINMQAPNLEMRPNIDYQGPRNDAHLRKKTSKTRTEKSNKLHKAWRWTSTAALKTFAFLLSRHIKDSNSEADDMWEKSQWKGLTRYLSNEPDDAGLNDTESIDLDELVEDYGKHSTVVAASEASIIYSYDIPGIVPTRAQPAPRTDGPDIGNGGAAPEWGINMIWKEATVHYGPWTDRQRVPLQSMLFPRYCVDASVTDRLQPGQHRRSTMLKVLIELQGDTIIRVPTREFSKNAEYFQKCKESPTSYPLRPFGWLELKVKHSSTIAFDASMVITSRGSYNDLRLDLKYPELRSSVNHGLLFSADSHIVNSNIAYPIKWNGLQKWSFDNFSRSVKTFFIREHVTLLIDLFKDFGAGPPPIYDLFTPARYLVTWVIEDFGIFLNINDLNIINNPSDFEDNTFINFKGDDLSISIDIPLEQIVSVKNQVDFSIKTPRFDLAVEAPPWHTLSTFLQTDGLGRAYDFGLDGSYLYYADVNPSHTDTLVMNLQGSNVTFICFGFIIKYLMKIRENYFGENAHFKTLEEYSDYHEPHEPEFAQHRIDNDLDVLIYVFVSGGSIILPANLYSVNTNLQLDFASLDTDVRFTNYYMDLQTNVSPIRGRYNDGAALTKILDTAKASEEFNSEIFIDGIVIHGHRLFGLPPTEPTYFCKWDLDIGDLVIDSKFDTIQALERAGKSLGYSFADTENSLLLPAPELFDVTFLTLKVGFIKVHVHTDVCSLELMVNSTELSLNDLANDRYSKRLSVSLPTIRLSLFSRPKDGMVPDVLSAFRTSIMITNFVQKRGAARFRELQQEHIALHDEVFNRASFLLEKAHRNRAHFAGENHMHPSISLPVVPPALTSETLPLIDPSATSEFAGLSEASVSSASTRNRYSLSPDLGSKRSISTTSITSLSLSTQINDASYGLHLKQEYEPVAEPEERRNSYLPTEKWHSLARLDKEFPDKGPNFDLHPTVHYSAEEPIAPRVTLDPEVEYDNFVIEFGVLEGYVGPKSLGGLNAIVEVFQHRNTEETLDDLQVDVLRKLVYINYGKPETINLRILLPSANIKYGSVQQTQEIHSLFENEQSHIYLETKDINIAVQIAKTKQPQSIGEYMQGTVDPIRNVVYFDLSHLSVGVRRGRSEVKSGQGREDYIPLSLQIEGMEFWYHEDETNVGSLRVRAIDTTISAEHVQWLSTYLEQTVREAHDLNQNQVRTVSNTQNRAAFVVHELAMAGERFTIEHDSSVLTKPAYVIRSPLHMRVATSWKILARLRHLLNSVPESWRHELDGKVISNTWQLPKHVRQDVIDVFMRWRSWELSNISASYFFRHVFIEVSLKDTIISSSTRTLLDIESIGARIQYLEEEDFILFDYAKMLLNWSKSSIEVEHAEEDEPTLDVELSLSCSKIRTRLSYKLLEVYGILVNYIPKRSEEEKILVVQKPHLLPRLNLKCTLFNKTASLRLVLPSVEVVSDSRHFRVSWLFNHLSAEKDASACLISELETMRLSLRDISEAPIFTHMMSNMESSFVFSGPILTSSKYFKLTVQQTRFSLNKNIAELAELITLILEKDYMLFNKYFGSSSQSKDMELSEAAAPKLCFFGPLYVRVEQLGGHADFNVTPSLRLRYNAGLAKFDLRQPDKMSFYSQAYLKGQTLDIRTIIDKEAKLFKLALSDLDIFGSLRLTELVNALNVGQLQVRLERSELYAESVSVLLRHLSHVEKSKELKLLQENVDKLLSRARDVLTPGAKPVDRPKRPGMQFAFNVRAAIDRTMTLATLADDSVALNGTGLSCSFNCFQFKPNGEPVRVSKSFSASVNECILALVGQDISDRQARLLSVQLDASYSENDGDAKDAIKLHSSFAHFHFSAAVLQRIAKLAERFKVDADELFVKDSEGTVSNEYHPSEEPNDKDLRGNLQRIAESVITSIEFENVAWAWAFDDSKEGSPGFLLGYEAFKVVASGLQADTSLIGAYITPADPKTIFLPAKCDPQAANTAFLPNIRLAVKYDLGDLKHPVLNAKLVADSLQITILPSIVPTVFRCLDSFTLSAAALERLAPKEALKEGVKDQVAAAPKPLRLPFSLRIAILFESARINAWDEQEFRRNYLLRSENLETPSLNPAMFLETPTVRAQVHYQLEERAHDYYKMDVQIMPSSNTLYPKAMPVVMAFYHNVKDAMQRRQARKKSMTKRSSKNLETARRLSVNAATALQQQANAAKLFKGLDVFVNVRFLRQEMTLSCAPTAKVAASVSHDGFAFTLNTADNDKERLISMNARLRNLKISLQHVYSREVSGYISLNDLMVFAAKHSASVLDKPIMVAGNLSDVTLDINLKQMQDLEIFVDIWRPSSLLSKTISRVQSAESVGEVISAIDREEGLVVQYRRATGGVAVPWNVDFSIINVHGVVDMGQNMGRATFVMDRLWLSSQKNVNWEQQIMAGLDNFELSSEGRLGGLVRLQRLRFKVGIMWEDSEGREITVPLVQAVVGLSSLSVKTSLDFHLFAMAYVRSLQFSLSNQHDARQKLGDRVFVIGGCDVFNLYLTSLAASNILDIYHTVMRMRSESHASYDAILKESEANDKPSKDESKKQLGAALMQALGRLRTMLDMQIDLCSVYVFPNTFTDNLVFTVILKGANARYGQEQQDKFLESILDMRMEEFTVALASIKRTFEETYDINSVDIQQFVDYARDSARGGTIVSVPAFYISMNTWQEYETPLVEFTFNSSFGGRVDIRWNIGAVQFIREMWETHVRSYNARREAYAMKSSNKDVLGKMNLAMDIDENLKEVELNAKYTYIPRAPPIIATPQLREMGEVTPPIEWIGLHRQKFPGITHQTVIVGLQQLVHEIEVVYKQLLGRSSAN